MAGYNPYRPDTNHDRWSERAGRPSRSNPAFREISDEGLAVAQEWFDAEAAEHKERQAAKERVEQWHKDHPEEEEAARQAHRSIYGSF